MVEMIGDGAVWVIGPDPRVDSAASGEDTQGMTTVLDESSTEIVTEIPTGTAVTLIEGAPGLIVEAVGRVWVTNAVDDSASVIHPGTR